MKETESTNPYRLVPLTDSSPERILYSNQATMFLPVVRWVLLFGAIGSDGLLAALLPVGDVAVIFVGFAYCWCFVPGFVRFWLLSNCVENSVVGVACIDFSNGMLRWPLCIDSAWTGSFRHVWTDPYHRRMGHLGHHQLGYPQSHCGMVRLLA